MKARLYPPIEKCTFSEYEKVDLYVVNSKFEKLYEIYSVDISKWKDVYRNLYEKFKEKTDNFSRYIIIGDSEDNVLYCSKIK